MVKSFIYLLLALAAGAYLSILLMEDPGYVLITFRGYSVEATLATIVLSLMIIFVVFLGVFKFISFINPFKLFQRETWHKIFFRKSPRLMTEKGLQKLLLGHWQESYKLLVESASRSQVPSVNFLAAAYAAFQRKDHLAYTYCLSQAKQNSLVDQTGIKTFQALLELKAGREEQGLALLLAAQKEDQSSPYVLELLKDIYLSLKDWKSLNLLLPDLEKYKVLLNADLLVLKETLAVHRLHQASEHRVDSHELKTVWNSFSKVIQKRELVMEAYLRSLLSSGESDEAIHLLTKFLKHQWSERLVELLGHINTPDAASQLLLVESWVKDRPKNVSLMLTLGRLSLRNKYWGKGREYFESALRFSENPRLRAEANAELARLLEHLGESELSLVRYREAIGKMEKALPELPMPSKS